MEPKAPIAAASAGVAKPIKMDPKAKEIRIVGGINPAKNSFHNSEKWKFSAALAAYSPIDL